MGPSHGLLRVEVRVRVQIVEPAPHLTRCTLNAEASLISYGTLTSDVELHQPHRIQLGDHPIQITDGTLFVLSIKQGKCALGSRIELPYLRDSESLLKLTPDITYTFMLHA